jgi:hypothetical protein
MEVPVEIGPAATPWGNSTRRYPHYKLLMMSTGFCLYLQDIPVSDNPLFPTDYAIGINTEENETLGIKVLQRIIVILVSCWP